MLLPAPYASKPEPKVSQSAALGCLLAPAAMKLVATCTISANVSTNVWIEKGKRRKQALVVEGQHHGISCTAVALSM